jgi:hypothetical protein
MNFRVFTCAGAALTAALSFIAPAGAQTASPSPSPIASPTPPALPAAKAPPLYTVPKGWTKLTKLGSLPAPLVALGNYVRMVDGNAHVLQIAEGPSAGLSVQDYAKLNGNEIKSMPGITVYADEPTTVCNGRTAWRLKYRKTDSGKALMMTMVMTVSGAHSYIGNYTRLASQKDDAGALATLQSLCPPMEASVADTSEVPFTPPTAWKRVNPSTLTSDESIVAMWLGDVNGAFPESVNVVRSHSGFSGSIGSQMSLMQDALKKKFPASVVRQSHAEQVCGRYDGWYIEYSATVQGHPAIIEQVIVLSDTSQYVATYGRPADRPETAAARQSLDTLCPMDASASS